MKPFRLITVLGALAALGHLAPAGAAPERFVLDRIGVARFTAVGSDRLQRTEGTLHLDGRLSWGPTYEQARPANLPAIALERVLVRSDDWFAYRRLGFGATANFQLGNGSAHVPVGDSIYWVAEINPEARYATGRVINVSTRARLAAAGDKVVAGFVIESRHRWVLIRGIGPGLAPFGVTGALADPLIGLRHGSMPLYVNDDWSTRPDVGLVRTATAQVGAFALPEGSKDAALLVELPPGAYTVVVESANPAATGEVLVEVYSVPEPDLD